MMSLSDLLSIALQIESTGYGFYTNLASMQTNEKLKNFFAKLADQEREHQKIFKELIGKVEQKIGGLSSWIEEETVGYLKSLAEVSIFPSLEKMKQNLSMQEALDLAINVEKDSIIFYSELIPYAADEVETIKKIINEEKRHLLDLLSTNL
ncbi:ferritin family protein [Pseudothermotoga thermarum]|uniref:Rubrerythrin n=1 Tax=Pseudothermotoga thermarum DSM 5069 TaxID=688269 RepID=F7YW11_9THEM|nr:ferritin family protein [Pseudothermotoga thermarum]AEH50498.1 Rubrerythrin [Pseudothermotoga thermarum DSM 5069]